MMMSRNKFATLVGTALLATILGACGTNFQAAVYVPERPPRAIVEVRETSPGPDHAWIQGYYQWSGHSYVWVPGHWERRPHGHARWSEGQWRHDRNRGWFWVEGRWR